MLLVTQITELAQAALAGLIHLAQNRQHFLASARELAVELGFLEPLQGKAVRSAIDEPAAAVTTVVVDEKRLITRRRRCDGRKTLSGIGLVVVGAQFGVRFEILAHTRHEGQRSHQHQNENTVKTSHNPYCVV